MTDNRISSADIAYLVAQVLNGFRSQKVCASVECADYEPELGQAVIITATDGTRYRLDVNPITEESK